MEASRPAEVAGAMSPSADQAVRGGKTPDPSRFWWRPLERCLRLPQKKLCGSRADSGFATEHKPALYCQSHILR